MATLYTLLFARLRGFMASRRGSHNRRGHALPVRYGLRRENLQLHDFFFLCTSE